MFVLAVSVALVSFQMFNSQSFGSVRERSGPPAKIENRAKFTSAACLRMLDASSFKSALACEASDANSVLRFSASALSKGFLLLVPPWNAPKTANAAFPPPPFDVCSWFGRRNRWKECEAGAFVLAVCERWMVSVVGLSVARSMTLPSLSLF